VSTPVPGPGLPIHLTTQSLHQLLSTHQIPLPTPAGPAAPQGSSTIEYPPGSSPATDKLPRKCRHRKTKKIPTPVLAPPTYNPPMSIYNSSSTTEEHGSSVTPSNSYSPTY
jgi:hypothetical protein